MTSSLRLKTVAPWCLKTILHLLPLVQYTEVSFLRMFSAAYAPATDPSVYIPPSQLTISMASGPGST
jgi:hypothetical protein